MVETVSTQTLIVGSGGNGIGFATTLQEAGRSDYVIITKDEDFGGTWWQNTYPGCAVDVPVVLYQFEFAITPEWSSFYAPQPELLAYMQRVARKQGLYEQTHFGTELLEAVWLEDEVCWLVTTNKRDYKAQFLVLVTGFLEEAAIPPIPGIDGFGGRVFHSSRWPGGYSGEGDRIAVVGTGASSAQIVPAMQPIARQVTVFQRTPVWVVPRIRRAYGQAESREMRADPAAFQALRAEVFQMAEQLWDTLIGQSWEGVQQMQKTAQEFLEQEVVDEDLRAILTPDHRYGCKRPIVSDDYYRALQQANVELVPEGVAEIGTGAVRTASGREFDVDAIVLATGFHFGGHILDRVKRRDGRSVAEANSGRPRAYKSVSPAGCPNLFLVGGSAPNGQIWQGISCGETVGAYVVSAMERASGDVRGFEVIEGAVAEWKRHTDEILSTSPVVSGGCVNYSQDRDGHNKAAWPGGLTHMRAELGQFDPTAYHVITPA